MEDLLRLTHPDLGEMLVYVFEMAVIAKAEVTVLRSFVEKRGIVIDRDVYDKALGAAIDAEVADMTTRSEYLGRVGMSIFVAMEQLRPDEDDGSLISPPSVHGD